MKIIKPSVCVMLTTDDTSPLEIIERCGRICYKSEDKITDGSAEKFVSGLIKRGHEAVLEHAVLILQMGYSAYRPFMEVIGALDELGYRIYLRRTGDGRYIVSGNVRAWRDFFKYSKYEFGGLSGFLQDFVQSHPSLFPEYQRGQFWPSFSSSSVREIRKSELSPGIERLVHYDITCIFTCDRGVSHEIVRHRDAGYCQESTRYCNYADGKFGGEITVIKPCFLVPGSPLWNAWESSCRNAGEDYFTLLEEGASPQEARAVLPNSLKTELAMTADIREWRHFLKLRSSPAAHPQMREVALMLLEQFHREFPDDFEDIEVSR